MKYLQSTLTAHVGDVVEVDLRGNAANVMLLDHSNLSNYRSGRSFRYYGGHFRRSPAHIPVPHSGTWNIVVDLGGYPGIVNAAVRVLTNWKGEQKMSRRSNLHVTRSGSQWNVRREGAANPTSTHRTQSAAINNATQIAKPERGEVIVHGRDNKIRERNTYGKDPFPPRGWSDRTSGDADLGRSASQL
jgi:hypothetical protein